MHKRNMSRLPAIGRTWIFSFVKVIQFQITFNFFCSYHEMVCQNKQGYARNKHCWLPGNLKGNRSEARVGKVQFVEFSCIGLLQHVWFYCCKTVATCLHTNCIRKLPVNKNSLWSLYFKHNEAWGNMFLLQLKLFFFVPYNAYREAETCAPNPAYYCM